VPHEGLNQKTKKRRLFGTERQVVRERGGRKGGIGGAGIQTKEKKRGKSFCARQEGAGRNEGSERGHGKDVKRRR